MAGACHEIMTKIDQGSTSWVWYVSMSINTTPVLCNSNSVQQPFFLTLQRGNGLPMSQVVSQRLIHRDPEEDQFTGSKLSKPMDFRAEKHPHELAKGFFWFQCFGTKLFRYAGVGPRCTVTTLLREMATVTKAWRKKKKKNNNHNCDGSILPRFCFFSFPTSKFLSSLRRIWAVLGVIVPRSCGWNWYQKQQPKIHGVWYHVLVDHMFALGIVRYLRILLNIFGFMSQTSSPLQNTTTENDRASRSYSMRPKLLERQYSICPRRCSRKFRLWPRRGNPKRRRRTADFDTNVFVWQLQFLSIMDKQPINLTCAQFGDVNQPLKSFSN